MYVRLMESVEYIEQVIQSFDSRINYKINKNSFISYLRRCRRRRRRHQSNDAQVLRTHVAAP